MNIPTCAPNKTASPDAFGDWNDCNDGSSIQNDSGKVVYEASLRG